MTGITLALAAIGAVLLGRETRAPVTLALNLAALVALAGAVYCAVTGVDSLA